MLAKIIFFALGFLCGILLEDVILMIKDFFDERKLK